MTLTGSGGCRQDPAGVGGGGGAGRSLSRRRVVRGAGRDRRGRFGRSGHAEGVGCGRDTGRATGGGRGGRAQGGRSLAGDPGQLRAPARRVRRARRDRARSQPDGDGPGDQPRAARRGRGDRLAGAVAAATPRDEPLPSRRCPSTTPSTCSSTAPAGPTLVHGHRRPTRPPSPRSAIGSTASHWPSNWPRPAAGTSAPNGSPPSWTTASGC